MFHEYNGFNSRDNGYSTPMGGGHEEVSQDIERETRRIDAPPSTVSETAAPDGLEELVLDTLRTAGGVCSPSALVDRLKAETNESDAPIINAIWRLVGRRVIDITADLQFQLIEDQVPA
jgi:hypothetical protein